MPTILVLGRSDVQGFGLPDPDRAWPVLLGERLRERTGLDVTIERRRLNIAADPTEYLSQVFADVHPDVVITSLTAYDYAAAHVQRKLDETVGKRVGNLARAIEKRTLPKDNRERPGLLHRSMRRLARRWVGAAPTRTRAEVVFAIERMFRFFARQEDTAVVMSYLLPGQALIDSNPGYAEISEQFRKDWLARARELHFHWADLNVGGSHNPHRLSDGVHFDGDGHAVMAGEFEDATLAALCDIYPGLRTSPAMGIA